MNGTGSYTKMDKMYTIGDAPSGLLVRAGVELLTIL